MNEQTMAAVAREAVECGCCPIDEAVITDVVNYLTSMYPDQTEDANSDRAAELYAFGAFWKASHAECSWCGDAEPLVDSDTKESFPVKSFPGTDTMVGQIEYFHVPCHETLMRYNKEHPE